MEMKLDRVMQPLDSNTVVRRMDKARSSDTDSNKDKQSSCMSDMSFRCSQPLLN